ncbi:MAG: HAD-IA family hydrolase [Clostridia bacterium]|nr:HAD-IA family hydrolase [Clostridia bacterium]
MSYKNLIFDFDGTLSDTYPCLTMCFLDVLHYFGLSDTYESVLAKLKISVGYAIGRYDFPVEYPEVSKKLKEYHRKRAFTEQFPIAGASELLEYASMKGCRNFIYTHSGTLPEELMKIWGIDGYFTEIVNSTYGFALKPSPEALEYLAEKYSFSLSECLMIGDRDIDTDCGRNAGMAGCLFDPDHYYDNTEVEYRITDLLQIKDLI